VDEDVGALHVAVCEIVLVHFPQQLGELIEEDEFDGASFFCGEDREDGSEECSEADGGFDFLCNEDTAGQVRSDSSFEDSEWMSDWQAAVNHGKTHFPGSEGTGISQAVPDCSERFFSDLAFYYNGEIFFADMECSTTNECGT